MLKFFVPSWRTWPLLQCKIRYFCWNGHSYFPFLSETWPIELLMIPSFCFNNQYNPFHCVYIQHREAKFKLYYFFLSKCSLSECSPIARFHIRLGYIDFPSRPAFHIGVGSIWMMMVWVGIILGGQGNILCALFLYFYFQSVWIKHFIKGAQWCKGNQIQGFILSIMHLNSGCYSLCRNAVAICTFYFMSALCCCDDVQLNRSSLIMQVQQKIIRWMASSVH